MIADVQIVCGGLDLPGVGDPAFGAAWLLFALVPRHASAASLLLCPAR